jgi:3-hydroxybutyryl-CoA dehydrogenase
MSRLFVVGAGTMGQGIAQLGAQKGFTVYLSDVTLERANAGLARVRSVLERQVEKGRMTKEEVEDTLNRITTCDTMEKVSEVDLVIEAALEDVVLKQKIFKELDERASAGVVLGSNTTSCSITEIASATAHPERVVGIHFYNPAPLMSLVEIMPGILTATETTAKAKELTLAMGKDPVVLDREGPAGITSRVLAGLLNEAIWVLFEGIASADEIDKAMRLGANHKMGPLELVDMIGLDIHLAKTKMLYNKTGDARYRPCYLVEQMVQAGMLGRKSGRGFYDYSQPEKVPSKLFGK